MSEHIDTSSMPNARRQGNARTDAKPQGNLMKVLIASLKRAHPNSTDDELLALWCAAANRDHELMAQIMDYAFTNTLHTWERQFLGEDYVPQDREEKQSTSHAPNNAPAQKPLVKPSLDLRTRETLSNQAERANRGLLFEIFIDGKLLRDCTIAEVRAHAKKAPVQAAFFNKIVLDTKGKSGATLIGDHYVDSKKLNQMYASVGGK